MIEYHRVDVSMRATDSGGGHGVTLQLIKPGTPDRFGTLWDAHALDAGLAQRLPTLCWSHDGAEPLGYCTGYVTSDDGPVAHFEFSDFDAVPAARRAWVQTKDGTVRDASIGFTRVPGGTRAPNEYERRSHPGIQEVVTQAHAQEVSLVHTGAVEGAKVLAVRSAGSIGQGGGVVLGATSPPGEGWRYWNQRGRLDAEVERLRAMRRR